MILITNNVIKWNIMKSNKQIATAEGDDWVIIN